MVCMGFGSCTVLIFSCPASALGLGGPHFCQKVVLTLTLQLANKESYTERSVVCVTSTIVYNGSEFAHSV